MLKLQHPNANSSLGCSKPELRRSSSFDRTWEETVAESVANELVSQVNTSNKGSSSIGAEQDEIAKNKSKDGKLVKPGRSSHEEKKTGKVQDEKRSRPRKLREFNNIKISQVGCVFFVCDLLFFYFYLVTLSL